MLVVNIKCLFQYHLSLDLLIVTVVINAIRKIKF